MSVKLLISGEAGAGKTSLTSSLEDAFVIYHDGKRYSLGNIPHTNVPTFDSSAELIAIITEKIQAYNDKFGNYPKTVVFDSVSRVFDTLYDACNRKYSNFAIYSNLDKEVKEFNDFIENSLIASGMNVIIISHALFDPETNKYNLLAKGSFGKMGSFYSTVDEALFLETKPNKRIVHFKSTKFPARTLNSELPENTPIDEFNLNDHVNKLAQTADTISSYEL